MFDFAYLLKDLLIILSHKLSNNWLYLNSSFA